MSALEKRTRAQQRLVAAQQPRRKASGATRLNPDDASAGLGSHETPTGESHDRASARTEGLELTGHLGSGRGTRTWLATEEQSREKFTVTFATATSAAERREQQRAMARVAHDWMGITDPHLVPVRGTIGDGDSVEALVSDYAAATSLAEKIAEDGRVPPADISPILAAAAEGLATLHDRGWVHGTLSSHRILLGPDAEVRLDGYGVPSAPADEVADRGADDLPAVSWGHDDRPEMLERSVARTPADDVKALATLAWSALTGRSPGSDSHRVPLTLVCPTAPRGLVLMLEAALNDQAEHRPTAHEFASGIAAIPAARTATRKTGPPGPLIIRADGTEVSAGRAVRHRIRLRPGGSVGTGRRSGTGVSAATLTDRRVTWRPIAFALIAAALVTGAWFGLGGLATEDGATVATEDRSDAQDAADDASVAEPARGDHAPSADDPVGAQDRAAEDAARELVSARAEALASGDERALAGVYVPRSRLAENDRATMAHAASQDGGASEYTALSGVSMEVDRIEPVRRDTGEESREGIGEGGSRVHRTTSGAHTFYAEILTRGWHGEIPGEAHADREESVVRQSVHLTVAETDEGWRIVDVTPVERERD